MDLWKFLSWARKFPFGRPWREPSRIKNEPVLTELIRAIIYHHAEAIFIITSRQYLSPFKGIIYDLAKAYYQLSDYVCKGTKFIWNMQVFSALFSTFFRFFSTLFFHLLFTKSSLKIHLNSLKVHLDSQKVHFEFT